MTKGIPFKERSEERYYIGVTSVKRDEPTGAIRPMQNPKPARQSKKNHKAGEKADDKDTIKAIKVT